MLIWSRWGILAAVIPFVCMLVVEMVVNRIFGFGYFDSNRWPRVLGMWLGAAGVYVVNSYLKKTQKGVVMIEKETGREVVLKSKDSLFFIDIKYWPLILIGLGFIFSVV